MAAKKTVKTNGRGSQRRRKPSAPPVQPPRPRRSDERLEEARQRTAELYDLAPVAYLTIDRTGIIRDLNLPAVELLGVARPYAIGLPFRLFVGTGYRVVLGAHLLRFQEEGVAVSELRILTPRARAIEVELRSRRTLDGSDLCFTAIINLSGQRQAEEERTRLEEAERAAREANRAKDIFIASLSHELRAPLAPVLIAISSLESGELPAAAMAHLCEIIRRNVKLQARLVDDLLDVSRIASNKMRIDPLRTDVHAAVLDALEMLEVSIRGRELIVTRELEAERHHVDGDPVRLRQVFVNLLRNAVTFTPPGGRITLRSWNRDGALVVEVGDNGRGIERGALSRIFNRFEQADPQTGGAGAGGGLGLGLAICKGIMDLHRGSISAHSAGPGTGARFLVELGSSTAEPAEPAGPPPRQRVKPCPPRRAVASAPTAHILVIEDEPDLAEALRLILQAQGYAVQVAPNAYTALQVDLAKIDVLISDVGLPDLDGRELLRQLRAKHPVPAVALSGYGTESDVQLSKEAGFLQHLTKPIDAEELLDVIETVVTRGERPPAEAENGAGARGRQFDGSN